MTVVVVNIDVVCMSIIESGMSRVERIMDQHRDISCTISEPSPLAPLVLFNPHGAELLFPLLWIIIRVMILMKGEPAQTNNNPQDNLAFVFVEIHALTFKVLIQ